MSLNENTVITDIHGYNPKKAMIFSEPIVSSVPDSKPKIEFKRINISTRNRDGSIGGLVFKTGRLFSFGVCENTSPETKAITGYTFPLCLYSKDGPTDDEKEWVETFNAIVEHCIQHLLDVKDEIDKFDLTEGELRKTKGGLNPLYWPREKYIDPVTKKAELRVIDGKGPTLYAKLIHFKKNNKFLTTFYDTKDNLMDPFSLITTDMQKNYCHATCAIKIESIFIGAKTISLQVKLYEAVVEPSENGMKRLLPRPEPQSKVLAALENTKMSALIGNNEMEDDDVQDGGSLPGSDHEPEPEPVPKTKKVIRKTKRVEKTA